MKQGRMGTGGVKYIYFLKLLLFFFKNLHHFLFVLGHHYTLNSIIYFDKSAYWFLLWVWNCKILHTLFLVTVLILDGRFRWLLFMVVHIYCPV